MQVIRYTTFLIIILALGGVAFASPDPRVLKAEMAILTADSVQGRDAPGPAADKVAGWIEGKFREFGLQPAFEGGAFRQEVGLQRGAFDKSSAMVKIDGAGFDKLRYGDDYFILPRRVSLLAGLSGTELVDCGYGVNSPGHEEITSAVRGKVALVKAGSDLPPEQAGMRGAAAFKAASAGRAGAAALVVTYPSDSPWPPPELADKIKALADPIVDLPGSEPDFPIIYLRLPKGLETSSLAGKRVAASYAFKDVAPVSGYNIAGIAAGKGDEWVILGAHYDHIGAGFPGADDNASGSIGLIESARTLAKGGKLLRSILFVAFTCEEDGLLGSQWLVQHLPFDREKIAAMINLDMIGRDGFASMREVNKPGATPPPDFAAVYYSASAPDIAPAVKAATDLSKLAVKIQPINDFRHFGDGGYFNSSGVPTIHITSGFHADYHKSTDTPDKIDYAKMTDVIDLAGQIVRNIADLPARPTFNSELKAPAGGAPY